MIAFNLSPAASGYTPQRIPPLYKSLVARMQAEPGVQSVAFASMGLLEGNEWDSSMAVEGYQTQQGEFVNPYCNSVSAGYFKTLGIPVLRGREFDARDEGAVAAPPDGVNDGRANGYTHAILNESFAKKYFGDADPIGRHIGFGGNPGTPTPLEIVGVVRDSKYTGVRDEIPRTVFFPLLEERTPSSIVMYVKTTADPAASFGAAQRAVRELDATVPVYNLRTLERQIDRSLVVERFVTTLSTAFGVLATLLAVVGLYGVMAFTVTRRTREIGVRMALGADRRHVLSLVVRQGLTMAGLGTLVGVIAALALSRLIESLLFHVKPTDPLTFAAVVGTLLGVAALACYVPAWRATRVDPTQALRAE
jgi:predicted permease